jgi:hypothetical protein
MATIKTYPLGGSTVLRINADRDIIDSSPEYQRRGELWGLDKRQLLIDSILNDYDIPKLYFHALSEKQKKSNSKKYEYSIIDGRQRLETIWSFINGDFSLDKDFEYLKDPKIKAGNLTYPELAQKYPRLKINLDSFVLPIILVETEDMDLIEDMFSRLNEAVPLNAAEKRNAIGGPMAVTIRKVTKNIFFTNKVKISDKRYQHREVATRLLFLEYSQKYLKKIIDTKKPYLDAFVREYKDFKKNDSDELAKSVMDVLALMNNVFTGNDSLLNSQSVIPIYYLLFNEAEENNSLAKISRQKFIKFNEERNKNRITAEKDITKANFDYLEYDRMSQQGTNDAASIKERLRIIKEYFKLAT